MEATERTWGAEFAKDFIALQKDLPRITKDDSVNQGKFSYSYAGLDTLVDKTQPHLAKHGFGVFQEAVFKDSMVGVITTLVHSSGQFKEFSPTFIPAKNVGPHDIGSLLTYCRRYSYLMALRLAPTNEDTDAVEIQQKYEASDVTDQAAALVAEFRLAMSRDIPEDELPDIVYAIHKRMWGKQDLQMAFGDLLMDKSEHGGMNEKQAFKDYVAMARERAKKMLPNGRAA